MKVFSFSSSLFSKKIPSFLRHRMNILRFCIKFFISHNIKICTEFLSGFSSFNRNSQTQLLFETALERFVRFDNNSKKKVNDILTTEYNSALLTVLLRFCFMIRDHNFCFFSGSSLWFFFCKKKRERHFIEPYGDTEAAWLIISCFRAVKDI